MFVTSLLSFAALGLAAIRGPLLEQPGDPGGGGAPAGGGLAPGSEPTADPAQGDVADAADQAGADELDAPDHDAGGDDADDEAFVNSLPEANLRTRVRRGQRYRKQVDPLVNLLRGADGKFLPPQEVNRILANSREFENFDRILRGGGEKGRKALQALMEADAELRNGGQAAAAEDEHPAFDEAAFEQAWPYEFESKEGRAFFERQKAEAKRTHALEGDVKKLTRLVTGVQQHTAQQTFSAVERDIKATVFAAAEELPLEYRETFVVGAKAQFDLLRQAGKLSAPAMKAVIDRMLAPVRAANKKQGRGAAAKASAMAAGNGALPKTPRPGTVAPASGTNTNTNKRETIKDASRSFFQRVGMRGR